MRAILSWFSGVVLSAGLRAQAGASSARKLAKKKATTAASWAVTQQEINALPLLQFATIGCLV
jgi:hypothetical protein